MNAPLVRDRKRCPHCGKIKPLGAFYGRRNGEPSSYCKTCVRIERARWRETDDYRAWVAAYLADPAVRDRRRGHDRKRAQARKPQQRAYRATAWARLLHCRSQARTKLRAAADPARRAALAGLIDQYEAELARIAMAEGRTLRPATGGPRP